MTGRRAISCALLVASVGACSLVTSVPDLTGGTIDASVDAAAACPPHVFTYDPHGRNLTSVIVSGSFNGWPKTIAAGGWPLEKSGSIWTTTRTLPRGKSTYKLVLDETEWIADPSNPDHEADGFGGQNSVALEDCSGGG